MNQHISLDVEVTLDMNKAQWIASYSPSWAHWFRIEAKKNCFQQKQFIEGTLNGWKKLQFSMRKKDVICLKAKYHCE